MDVDVDAVDESGLNAAAAGWDDDDDDEHVVDMGGDNGILMGRVGW